MTWRIEHGDCLDVMRGMADASVDAVVSDPPYGLAFMGKQWDHGVPGVPFWTEALRVAKPGAHLLAFGGTRTFHRLAVAIEDAGWEVRDCLSWMFGSGFPKSHNLDGAWEGWGTALKPAWEPVIVARKPLVGTVARNVSEFGTGALNVDGCRIEGAGPSGLKPYTRSTTPAGYALGMAKAGREVTYTDHPLGRWPANVMLDEDAAAALDAQSGERPGMKPARLRRGSTTGRGMGFQSADAQDAGVIGRGDSGGASRFFYVAKASRSERNAGLEGFPEALPVAANGSPNAVGATRGSLSKPRANVHPTVKPVAVMRWLCRLVTPPGGIVLDPFMGSGTTGVAAVREGFRFVGIEREAEYVEIARARVAHAAQGQVSLPGTEAA